MLQITKAWHIPSGRVKTGTIQKQNLSLGISQAERAPECQEQSRKREGLSSKKRAFLKGWQCVPAASQRAVRASCEVGMLADFFKGQQGAAVPPHDPHSAA